MIVLTETPASPLETKARRMSTPCEIPGEAAPVEGAAAPVARSVAEDLEAIFPNEPRTQPPQTLRLRPRRRRGGERSPRGASFGRVGAAGALAAAALAGVSAGAMLGRGTAPAAHKPQPVLQVKMAAATLPSPGPLPAGPLHAPAPPPQILVAEARPTEAAPPKVHKASVQRRHAASAHRPRCGGAHCRSSSVMEADGRLRRAYAGARSAGVSSTVLADYRERWETLRHRARREPRVVAARYDAMASDLNRMAARHEAERTTSHPGPWRALRTQIAALWR